ncbi:MarR family winged helix-turn-helix transcriptional regulator [Pusillimonas minor]|uniref:MarR family transcriptional regulator n=1 Tax=Pusillimonas minor TaxID=2697024 RepID=A0A842HQC6_9BURK|nr:MarR family transcriptional regulator [Pusillimonas minor]MBC2769055.1 MarR family transcriptional regulator [Pusillimonas minor]
MKKIREPAQPKNPLSHKEDLPDDITPEVFSSHGLWSRPGFLVRRLNQIHYAMFFEECTEGSITPVQYGILTVLSQNPWLDQTTIGYELGLDRTTSADVIKRLEDKGLLERRVNPQDKRSRQANITPAGLELMVSLKDSMARAQQRLIEPLSPSNRKLFLSLLTELVEANNQYGRAALKAV